MTTAPDQTLIERRWLWRLAAIVSLGFTSVLFLGLSMMNLVITGLFTVNGLADEFGAGDETAGAMREALLKNMAPSMAMAFIGMVVCLVLLLRGKAGWSAAITGPVVGRAAILFVPSYVAMSALSLLASIASSHLAY